MTVWLLYSLVWSPVAANPVPTVTVKVYRESDGMLCKAAEENKPLIKRICVKGHRA